MRALKIVSAIIMVAIVVAFAFPMLNDLFNPYCDHKGLSAGVWLALAAVAVWLVHINLPKTGTPDSPPR